MLVAPYPEISVIAATIANTLTGFSNATFAPSDMNLSTIPLCSPPIFRALTIF